MGILEEPFNLFVYLSESIGLNLAIPLFFITPAILFIAKPSSSSKLRVWLTVIALVGAYFFINLTLHTHHSLKWNAYRECQSQFSDGGIQHHTECGKINIADGAAFAFYIMLGWIPGGAYVGVWELIWRRIHRKYLREHGVPKHFWVTSIPVWLLSTCLILPAVSILVTLFRYYMGWLS